MIASLAKRVFADLAGPPPPRTPDPLHHTAAALLHARHLRAYQWAVPFVAGRDTLEIGVNAGYGSRLLAPVARTFLGVDLSLDSTRRASSEARIRALQADGQYLPFADSSFDCVVSFQVIEHVWHDASYLREIRRVLRPNGLALLSSPNRRLRLLAGQFPWNEEHLREYDGSEWSARLREHFEDVEVLGLFGDPAPTALELARTRPDPWKHYFGGSWGMPIRMFGRVLNVWRRRQGFGDLAEAVTQLQGETDTSRVRHFFLDREQLDGALDLLALCRKTNPDPATPHGASFNVPGYWRQRLTEHPSLRGTGTRGFPLAWQRWMYRGKVRAYARLLRRNTVALRGRVVLDLGCGTGVLEDYWERHGARRAHGIDVVPELVRSLAQQHSHRRYVCADLADRQLFANDMEAVDLVTAIDVLYHIVDDRRLTDTLRNLLAWGRPDSLFLFTDALHESQPAAHVRFRSINQWKQLLTALGWRVVDREPVFAVNNRAIRGVYRFPAVTGALQHFLDAPVLRTMPWLANNWAVLARRSDRA